MRVALLLDVDLGEDDNLPKEEVEDLRDSIADALASVDAEEALKGAIEAHGYAVDSVTCIDFERAYGKGMRNLRKLRQVR